MISSSFFSFSLGQLPIRIMNPLLYQLIVKRPGGNVILTQTYLKISCSIVIDGILLLFLLFSNQLRSLTPIFPMVSKPLPLLTCITNFITNIIFDFLFRPPSIPNHLLAKNLHLYLSIVRGSCHVKVMIEFSDWSRLKFNYIYPQF